MCVCTYAHTHTHIHASLHTPYIIFAHILICVWTALFTLLWLQHQHLSWTFPGLEAADTPSFDSTDEGAAASSLHSWWMFWQVLLFPRANELHFCVKRQEIMKNVERHTHGECGLITALRYTADPANTCVFTLYKPLLECKPILSLRFRVYYLMRVDFLTCNENNSTFMVLLISTYLKVG